MRHRRYLLFSLLLAGSMAGALAGEPPHIAACPAIAMPDHALLSDPGGQVPPLPVYPPSAGIHYSGCAYAWNVDYPQPILFTIARFEGGVLVEAIESTGMSGNGQASLCRWHARGEQLSPDCENARMFWTMIYKSDPEQLKRYQPNG